MIPGLAACLGARIPHYPPRDPLFAQVMLLLNGDTTLTDDQSSFNRTLTAIGSEALNSGVTLFGNPTYASPANAAGSYLNIDSVTWAGSFGSAEFCIEGWHYPEQDYATFQDYNLFRIGALFSGSRVNGSGAKKLTFSCSNINSTSYSIDTGTDSSLIGEWLYYAFVRDNSIAGASDFLRLYAGPLGGTATQRGFFSFTKGVGVGSPSTSPKEAQGYDGNRNAGRMGPFRFSIGATSGRYYGGASFPVPNAVFPSQ